MHNRNHERITLALSFATYIILGMPGGFIGVAWPSIKDGFSLPLDELGKQLLVNTIFFTLASYTAGPLINRFGMGRFFLACVVVDVAGLAGMAAAPTWALFLAANAAVGFASGALTTATNIHLSGRYRASMFNWLHSFFGLGSTMGPIIITALLKANISWRIGFQGLSAALAILAIAVLATLKMWDSRPEMTSLPAGHEAQRPAGLRQTLALPIVLLSMAVFFMYTGVEVTAGQWAYSLFTLGRGIDPVVAGAWVSVYWGSFTIGRMALGFAVDRFGIPRVLRTCMLGAMTGAALMWWNPLPLVSFLGLALIGLSFAPIFPTLVSNTTRITGPAHAPNAISLEVGTASLGYAAVPGLAGILANRISLEIIPPYLIAATAVMLALFELLVYRRMRRAPAESRTQAA